jgi:hypothetical protein
MKTQYIKIVTALIAMAVLGLVGCAPQDDPAARATTPDQPGGTAPEAIASADVVPTGLALDSDDIGGTVLGPNGPEAGVWVIAETDELGTMFARIVVTDEQGRFLLPDLPAAGYRVWVRGYGLADSPRVSATRGQHLALAALAAPDPAIAALSYPAAYWYAMMALPAADELQDLPHGLNGYLMWMKNMGCVGCHQMGNLATRTIPEPFGNFETSHAAWAARVSAGQAGDMMLRVVGMQNGLPLKYLADWSDRIAAGELPASVPPRPSGLERNLVATVRDWSTPSAYMHDLSGTDRRNPTVNAYGKIYGAPEYSTDDFPILDPVANVVSSFRAPVRDAQTPNSRDDALEGPSAYWGDSPIWNSQANAHNPMLDQRGRVWYTASVRAPDNPDFCKAGSTHPSAQRFPLERADRHLAVLDPQSGEYTFVDTCYGTHHLQFAEDDNNTLWTSGGRRVVGWFDTKKFDETGDAQTAQGWAPFVLDTNGNGSRDEWVEPDQLVQADLDKRIVPGFGFYAVMPNPADGSVWGSIAFRYPGSIARFDPLTQLTEIYHVPLPGFGVRGADIDRNGVVWVSLGSGHLGEFDRRKCTSALNGPQALGDHCPEGWTFHDLPGPAFADLPGFSVESSYYTWVDQHNTLGLGANVPIATGNLFDGVHALVNNEFVTLRIPYPLGFYTKGFEGRIDDPDQGWKGRGLWVPEGDRTPWLKEGGKGSKPLVVHFQMRPNPLAK